MSGKATESGVHLRAIDRSNVRDVINLSVSDAQDDFVAPNVISLAEAYAADRVWVRAIYDDDIPVGFLMLSDDDVEPRYYLWRFMIDERYQGRGYGAVAMRLLHEYVRSRPSGDEILVSYVREDGGPEAFYKGLGYVDTGDVSHSRHNRHAQYEAVLDLRVDIEGLRG